MTRTHANTAQKLINILAREIMQMRHDTGVCDKNTTTCLQAFALQSGSRNCYPAPDLVLRGLIFPGVFFSGGVSFSRTPVCSMIQQERVMYIFYYYFNNLRFKQHNTSITFPLHMHWFCLFQVKIWNVGCWSDCQTTLWTFVIVFSSVYDCFIMCLVYMCCCYLFALICLFQVKIWNVGCWSDCQTTLWTFVIVFSPVYDCFIMCLVYVCCCYLFALILFVWPHYEHPM